MSIFSKYKGIYNQNDSLMSVSEAINEINLTLDEYFSNDDNELDIQTRFAITFMKIMAEILEMKVLQKQECLSGGNC